MKSGLDSIPINAGFEHNVFINCPFDKDYIPLLRPLLFTKVYLEHNPRIAFERSDSDENRIDKISQLIKESKWSIHDLSRLKSQKADEFYRLNMPFELGFDHGARMFGVDYMRGKRCLILEHSLHDFKRALSDISGVDSKAHSSGPEEIVRAVRDWFVETVGICGVRTATVVWYEFNDFTSAFYEQMLAAGSPEKDIEQMPIPEYVDYMREWVSSVGTMRAKSAR